MATTMAETLATTKDPFNFISCQAGNEAMRLFLRFHTFKIYDSDTFFFWLFLESWSQLLLHTHSHANTPHIHTRTLHTYISVNASNFAFLFWQLIYMNLFVICH